MAVDLLALCADLRKETDELDALVAGLDADGYRRATPAPAWSIRDQLTHLARFDDDARLSLEDPAAFRAERDRQAGGPEVPGGPVQGLADRAVAADRRCSGPESRAWWRRARSALLVAAAPLDPSARVPWYGPDMTVASSLTARLMETWAHGQDVADALGVDRVPTARLAHVAFLCARTVPNSFTARGLPPPEAPVRVELEGPGGQQWVFGHAGATDVVRGPALDLCLVATQRRHRDDTKLVAAGPVADRWLSIAQAFAGPPGGGRPPHRR